MSTRVLPEPAPARINSGPSPCVTASRWGSLRPSSSSWRCSAWGLSTITFSIVAGSAGVTCLPCPYSTRSAPAVRRSPRTRGGCESTWTPLADEELLAKIAAPAPRRVLCGARPGAPLPGGRSPRTSPTTCWRWTRSTSARAGSPRCASVSTAGCPSAATSRLRGGSPTTCARNTPPAAGGRSTGRGCARWTPARSRGSSASGPTTS